MNEMWKQVIFEGLQGIIGIAITVLLAFIRKKYNQYVNTDTKKKLVNDVVYYTEQVFKALHGKEKLEKAKSTLVTLLNEKGISFTEEELNVLIESAVNQLNIQQGSIVTALTSTVEETVDAEPIVEETVETSEEELAEDVNLTDDDKPKG